MENQAQLPKEYNSTINSKFHSPVVLFVFFLVAILISTIGGYILDTRGSTNPQNRPKGIVGTINTTIPSPTPSDPNDTSDFVRRLYQNQKYNFKFLYTEDVISDGGLGKKHELLDQDNKITINEYTRSKQGWYGVYTINYIIYDVKPEDKNNLTNWWKNTIKQETLQDIPEKGVSFNADLLENQLPFEKCILNIKPDWQAPPSLTVTPKNGQNIKSMVPHAVFYLYYDFGKPFILRFERINPQRCHGYQAIETLTNLDSLSY